MRNIFTLILFSFFFGNGLAQVNAGVPDDIIQCDVNNPGDETEIFDLTQNEAVIINGQSNVVVTYHITSGGALSGINAIPNPENYQNIANPEPIWARLQSTAGQGWSVVSFQLFVPKIPVVASPPDNIFVDEGDGNSEAVFDLTVNEAQMLGGVDPFDFQFNYFTSQADALNNENPISDPEAYTNVTNPQIIYGRYEYFISGCEVEFFEFEIQTDGALGLEEALLGQVALYPNPTSDELFLVFPHELSEVTLQVYNPLGVLIMDRRISNTQISIPVDISSLALGTYFIKFMSEGQSEVKSFIKK